MKKLWLLVCAFVLGVVVVASADTPIDLKVDDVTGARGQAISVAVRITSASLNEADDVRSYQFGVSYDPTMLRPEGLDVQGTLAAASGVQFQTNIDKLRTHPSAEPVVKIALASSAPLSGSDVLAVVVFDVLGPSLSETPVSVVDVLFNEGPELLGSVVDGTVTIENRPPVIQPIPPLKVIVGQTMELTVRAVDPDGDGPVTFSLAFTQGGAVFDIDPQTGAISYTPALADTGTYVAVVTATDTKGASSDAELTVTVDKDRTPPVIIGTPSVPSVSTTGATIVWKTNERSTSIVRYGLPGGSLATVTDPALVILHVVTLSGLASNTTYRFEVQSLDELDNPSEVATGQFTTQEEIVIQPPVLTKKPYVDRGTDFAFVKWETDRYATSVVRYGTSAATYTDSATGASGATHNVAVTGLTPATRYYYSVRSVDAFGIAVTSPDTFFQTKALLLPPKVTPPTVSSRSHNSFTVAWNTDRAATSIIQYGRTSAYGNTIITDTSVAVTSHSVTVTGLEPSTKYHYRVGSTGPEGLGPTYSIDQSVFTLAEPDTRPPQWVKQPDVPSPGFESATIVFETDEAARVEVDYGVFALQNFQYTNTVERTTLAKRHRVQLLNLTPVTAYRYRVRVYDFFNNGPTEATGIFTTADVPDTKPPVILNDWIGTEVTDRSATVRWLTDEPANSKVIFEVSGAANTRDEVFDPDFVNEHNIFIPNLDANTRYSLTIATADAQENTTTAGKAVTTKAKPDTLPPVVVAAPKVESQTLTDANLVNVILTVGTDELAQVTARYGPSEGSLSGQVSTTSFARIHRLTFTNLLPATTIFYQITYVDASNRQNARVGPVRRFNTIAGKDITAPLIKSGPSVVDVKPHSITVAWVTDEASSSRLRIATGPAQVRETPPVVDGTFVQRHIVTATNLEPGTKYYWRVASDDPSGNRVVSQVSTQRTLLERDSIPPVFTVFPAVLYTSDALAVLRWATDENARGDVYLAAEGDEFFDVIHDEAFKRRHNVSLTNLEAGKQYIFFVEAVDATGNSSVAGDSSAPVFDGRTAIQKLAGGRARIAKPAQGRGGSFQTAVAPDVTFPVITARPKVVGSTTNTATLDWETDETANSVVRFLEAPSGKPARGAATQQDIIDNGTPVSQTEFVATHQVTVTQLHPGTSYLMIASSTDPSGNGETYSDIVTVTTPQAADLTPPAIVSGSIQALPTQTQAVIRWDTDELSDSRVSWGASAGDLANSRTEPDPTLNHQVILTNLKADSTYYYTVSSTDARGNGPTTSTVLSFTTEKDVDTTPPNITDIVVKRVTNSTATVGWQTDEAAGTFIEYGETTAFGRVSVDPTAVTTHEVTITNLQSLTPYYFHIEATDRVGNSSAFTPTDSLTTSATPDTVGPNAPAEVDTIPASGRIVLRWVKSTSDDIAGYIVYRNGTRVASGVADTSYEDRSVQNDVTYTYQVQGVDYVGNEGAKSATVRETPRATESPSAPTPVSPVEGVTASDTLVVTVANASPAASRPGDQLTYSFVLASDSLLANVIATTSNVAQGDQTTSWEVPGYQLIEGEYYYWAAQAQGSVSAGPITHSVRFRWIPVAVQLESFAAVGQPSGAVRVRWALRVNRNSISEVSLARGADAGSADLVKLLGPEGINGDVRDVMVAPGTTPTYWLTVTDQSGRKETFGPVAATSLLPSAWSLSPARPNPFNPTTEVLLAVPEADNAEVLVYNILGQPVATLWSGPITPGIHRLRWDAIDREGRAVSSGVYIVRLRTARGITKTQRVTMLR